MRDVADECPACGPTVRHLYDCVWCRFNNLEGFLAEFGSLETADQLDRLQLLINVRKRVADWVTLWWLKRPKER
jgi:hypothetical protein